MSHYAWVGVQIDTHIVGNNATCFNGGPKLLGAWSLKRYGGVPEAGTNMGGSPSQTSNNTFEDPTAKM